MSHIKRLLIERDEAQEQLRRAREELIELETYLTSPKFAWPDNDYVHVKTDILPKLSRIRFQLT